MLHNFAKSITPKVPATPLKTDSMWKDWNSLRLQDNSIENCVPSKGNKDNSRGPKHNSKRNDRDSQSPQDNSIGNYYDS